MCQWLGFDLTCGFALVYWLNKSIRIQRSRWRWGCISCRLLKSFWAICCSWSLKAKKIYSLLAINACLHGVRGRHFGLFKCFCNPLMTLLPALWVSLNGLMLLHELADEETIIKLLNGLDCIGNLPWMKGCGRAWPLWNCLQCFRQCYLLFDFFTDCLK